MGNIYEALGWLGVLLILGSYALLSFGIISSEAIIYQTMNLVGAVGIIFSSYKERDMQPVVLNIAWALIAIISIVSIL